MKRRTITIALTALALPMSALAADLKIGDPAPAFEAKDQDGATVSSTELYKSGATVFFFYPKAGTGG